MARSEEKQRHILEIAEAMFRERGVEGTTLAELAKASKASVGSLTHHFGEKPNLAAAVLDRVVERLADEARTALSPEGRSVEQDVRALLITCVKWPGRDGRLIAMLEPYAAATWRERSARLHGRLAPLLTEWAARRGDSEVARLKPGQLYAVILAPALCSTTATVVAELTKDGLHRWLDILTAAALTAIKPPDANGHLMGKEAKPRRGGRPVSPRGGLL